MTEIIEPALMAFLLLIGAASEKDPAEPTEKAQCVWLWSEEAQDRVPVCGVEPSEGAARAE